MDKEAYLRKRGKNWYVVERFKDQHDGQVQTFLGDFGNALDSRYDGAELTPKEERENNSKSVGMQIHVGEIESGDLGELKTKVKSADQKVGELNDILDELRQTFGAEVVIEIRKPLTDVSIKETLKE